MASCAQDAAGACGDASGGAGIRRGAPRSHCQTSEGLHRSSCGRPRGPTDFAALARIVAEFDAATGGPDDRSDSNREQKSDAARARTLSPSGRRSRNRTVSVDALQKRSKTETPVEEEDEELEREEFPRQISDDRRKQETIRTTQTRMRWIA